MPAEVEYSITGAASKRIHVAYVRPPAIQARDIQTPGRNQGATVFSVGRPDHVGFYFCHPLFIGSHSAWWQSKWG